MELNISQLPNATFVGPLNKSDPDVPARENPGVWKDSLTNVRVGVMKVNVPTPEIAIVAEESSIKNPPLNDIRLAVSATSVIVKAALVKEVPPTEPDPVPV